MSETPRTATPATGSIVLGGRRYLVRSFHEPAGTANA
jgi:hypothetical protein